MKIPTHNYVVITGASAGIGLALAHELASRKYPLLLIARRGDVLDQNAETLKQKYGVAVRTLACDLLEPTSREKIFQFLETEKLSVDIWINNAAYGSQGLFEKSDRKNQLDMIELNVSSLVDICHRAVQWMKSHHAGKILNVASTAGFHSAPNMAVYAATKAFVVSFTEAIRMELEPSGIQVSCLCPGPTESEFAKRAGFQNEAMLSRYNLSAEVVAKQAINGLFRNQGTTITGIANQVLVGAIGLAPRSWTTKIAGNLLKKAARPSSEIES